MSPNGFPMKIEISSATICVVYMLPAGKKSGSIGLICYSQGPVYEFVCIEHGDQHGKPEP